MYYNIQLSIGDGTVTGAINSLNTDITSKLSNISLLANPIAGAKSLHIYCDTPNYNNTAYFVVITRGGYVTQVLIIQAYTDSATFTILEEGRVIKLYDATDHPISQVSAIAENGKCRVKILMKNVSDAYRGYVTPLGNVASVGIKYTATWGIS